MGLLDDAIREHLELKRLRAPERPGAAPDPGTPLDPRAGGDPIGADGDAAHDRLPPEPRDEAAAETAATRDAAGVTEETAELDMRAELVDDLDLAPDPAPLPDRHAPGPIVGEQGEADAQ
jgi:hypothetical protein